jgi:hypothetical protein
MNTRFMQPIPKCTKGWEDCVCPKGDFEEWHKVNCLMGECVECGVGKLLICLNECFCKWFLGSCLETFQARYWGGR